MSKTSTDNLIVEGPRSTRGSIPTKALYYDTAADEKKAKGLNWVFYRKYDINPIVLVHNHSAWPAEITLADKLSMTKPRKINFKDSVIGKFRASFVKIVPAKESDDYSKSVTAKIASTDRSLSDISSIA